MRINIRINTGLFVFYDCYVFGKRLRLAIKDNKFKIYIYVFFYHFKYFFKISFQKKRDYNNICVIVTVYFFSFVIVEFLFVDLIFSFLFYFKILFLCVFVFILALIPFCITNNLYLRLLQNIIVIISSSIPAS